MLAPQNAVHGLYGFPLPRLAAPPPGAVQFSPLVPGSAALEEAAPQSLSDFLMAAPPSTLERRHTIALALRALQADGAFTIMAANDQGGTRLAKDVEAFGCAISETAKAHHRIVTGQRPAALDEAMIAAALQEGAPRRLETLGLWTQPGLFSWDRLDPGTLLLTETLAPLSGRGADLGCGLGILAHAILASPKVQSLDLVDIDRRAIELARRNVNDPRARFFWSDVRGDLPFGTLDFIVMNPPFHEAGHEDKGLGQIFIRQAAHYLRKGGVLWLVANRHLPYERVLAPLFRRTNLSAEAHGYKVVEAVK
jgi:16S rRNA (guanine1207-N2)-methyltransferase